MIAVQDSAPDSEKIEELKEALFQFSTMTLHAHPGPETRYLGKVALSLLKITDVMVGESITTDTSTGPDGEEVMLTLANFLPARAINQLIHQIEEINLDVEKMSHDSEKVLEHDAYLFVPRVDGLLRTLETTEQFVTEQLKDRPLQGVLWVYRRIIGEIGLAKSEYTAEVGARRTEQIVGDVEELASTAAASRLAQHFDAFAQSELRSARLWIGFSFVLTGLLTWFAFRYIKLGGELEWVDVVRRAVVGVPLVFLLLYSLKEGRVHRSQSLWCRHVAVQLQTIHAYTDGMRADSRENLRNHLGELVFTGAPALVSTYAKSPVDEASIRRIVESVLKQRVPS